MKLTTAEKNHLIHVARENSLLRKGPALTWNGENGIYHHDILPLFELFVRELRETGEQLDRGEAEPTVEWAPPAASGEEFRKRIIDLTTSSS